MGPATHGPLGGEHRRAAVGRWDRSGWKEGHHEDPNGGRADRRAGAKVALAGVLALVMGLLVAGAPARAADGGSNLWTRRYDGPASGDDYVTGMAVSPDGSRLFVTGFGSGVASGNDYATVAFDASTGTRLWTRRYDGPARAQDAAEDVAVSPDGSTVFVTGNSRGVTSGSDIVTIAYAAVSGTTRWTARYDGPAGVNDEGVAVVPGPYGGTVFVTGWSVGAAHGADYATLAYSTDDGCHALDAPLLGARRGLGHPGGGSRPIPRAPRSS